MSKPDVAFIGLGAMGFGMATHLVHQGYRVTGFDVWRPTLDRFAAAGGRTADSPAAAVAACPVCVCMVATAAQAQEVLVAGPGAALAALPTAAVVLLCSTVPCGYVQGLARQLATTRPDIVLVDCPVSGGAARAAAGTLSIMVGAADNAALLAGASTTTTTTTTASLARSVLADLADPQRLYVVDGGIGAGSNTKMVHQVLAAVQLLAASEAMALAARLGKNTSPPATPSSATLDALLASPGASWFLGHRGPRMLSNFQPLASAINIIAKDTAIITSEARRLGFVAPLTSVAENSYLDAQARGFGTDDDSSLLRIYLPAASFASSSASSASPVSAASPPSSLGLVVDLLKGIHLAAAAESLAFAHHVGLDLDLVLDLCIHAAGGSAMLQTHGPAIVAALRNASPTTNAAANTSADAPDTLQSIALGLTAAVDAAQQLKAPLFLGTQALNLIRTVLRSVPADAAANAGAATIVKAWV